MEHQSPTNVHLRLWSKDDLSLLERLMGDPAMTVYLEGPESPEQIRSRHDRYCRLSDTDKGLMYVIVVGAAGVAAGSVGYWETEWQGQTVWETGWSVLPEFQGQGIATKATMLVVELVRRLDRYRFLHAFPMVTNGASNAVCRKAGFTLQSEVELEAWREPGKMLRFNDWRLDLSADQQ
ncbi:MAG: GNAT family N-acetyltransferase [Anaerolineaceae bacterium]|nr:GNAT family N-acetyltransferase [Anaerolineaceae bacterium]